MGRIRTLKPEFFRSRSLARCSVGARLTFQGLWCEADDHGHGIADPRILKGALWPLDDEIGHAEVDQHLIELAQTGHIELYDVGDERYFEVVSWEEHQSAAYRRGKAMFPAPDGTIPHAAECETMHDARDSVQDAQSIVLEGNEEGNEEGRGAAKPRSRPRGTRIPLPYRLSDADKAWLEKELSSVDAGFVERETRKFVDYWRAKSGTAATKLDWPATWRNWMRRAHEGWAS